MNVTLFTDAAFRSADNKGTWAISAECGGEVLRKSGIIKSPLTNSTHAELWAIANGLVVVKSHFHLSPSSCITVETDSKGAIFTLKRKIVSTSSYGRVVPFILDFCQTNKYKIIYNYIPAHQKNPTPKGIINSWCDRECAKQMYRFSPSFSLSPQERQKI